ncbi:serine/threonine protein phosphatase [Clostridium carboxidivorans P7]|uniref:Protein serine/threonine phosphatase n=1 Tax=Clostridium carboxidivorans P7 TaxID=536227 RepID=C6PUL4_9CLOT|nr:SpoIIE family protein phosphatase [Clostridium carboxidivorans]AKN30197.1 serine/threonine protein phosphatase [Clostridium carboxidivorans P7]EET87035.1 protein serine/threonine phosphatase [Clostridium carboxidivorans P7]
MKEKETPKEFSESYIKNIFKILLVSSIIISFAVIITAFLGYENTKNSLISKAKSQDIVFMVKSMAAKIDGRINRAVETSYIFSRDPLNVKWINGEEKDQELGKLVLSNLENIENSYDYNYAFIAGVNTKHYYFRQNSNKSNKNFMVLSESNPDDRWFYQMLKSKKPITFNINYDIALDESFLFVNTIMGTVENPIGITGVGLNLNSITKEFKEFKVGKKSNLWMVDENGVIKLSDKREDIGKKVQDFLPKDVIGKIKDKHLNEVGKVKVEQYYDFDNEINDYAYCKLNSTDWTLFYKIPRKESISLIDSLRVNTIITVILVLLFFMLLYYFISKKIANPYKQVMLLNSELDYKVNIRTKELRESNEKIKDSIEYAKRLQESILPLNNEIKKAFKDNFVIWKPRDIVGGDFFWLRQTDDVTILAVGDCTGHGVPGALMTMTVNAILHNIVSNINKDDPSIILKELHTRLKETLNKSSNPESVDDGLDIAIFCINKKSNLLYCSANLELYIKNGEEVRIFKPQTKGVGYNYIKLKENLCNENISIEEGDILIVTTDGFIHQNGGQKNYPFGKKRLYNMIQKCEAKDLDSMKVEFENTLQQYMNGEEQRDDITVFAFKIK